MEKADKRRILIVEDSPDDIEYYQSFLGDYELKIATDGDKAIKILRKEKFDLVILDLDMPRVRGDEVLKFIREDPELREIKVLVITGTIEALKEGEELRARAKAVGESYRSWEGKFSLLDKTQTSSSEIHQTIKKMLDDDVVVLDEKRSYDSILIVEDEPQSVEKIKKDLQEKAYSVFCAPDGEIALNILSEKKIDLVLLDLGLPKIRGEEIIKIMRNHPVLSHIPIIIYSSEETMDEFHGAIKKPSQPKGIRRLLHIDKPEKILQTVKEAIEQGFVERRKGGYGYLKEKQTFIRNKEGRYVRGSLECYKPWEKEVLLQIYPKMIECEYCGQEKKAIENRTYVYSAEPPYFRKEDTFKAYICSECMDEIKQKYNV